MCFLFLLVQFQTQCLTPQCPAMLRALIQNNVQKLGSLILVKQNWSFDGTPRYTPATECEVARHSGTLSRLAKSSYVRIFLSTYMDVYVHGNGFPNECAAESHSIRIPPHELSVYIQIDMVRGSCFLYGSQNAVAGIPESVHLRHVAQSKYRSVQPRHFQSAISPSDTRRA